MISVAVYLLFVTSVANAQVNRLNGRNIFNSYLGNLWERFPNPFFTRHRSDGFTDAMSFVGNIFPPFGSSSYFLRHPTTTPVSTPSATVAQPEHDFQHVIIRGPAEQPATADEPVGVDYFAPSICDRPPHPTNCSGVLKARYVWDPMWRTCGQKIECPFIIGGWHGFRTQAECKTYCR